MWFTLILFLSIVFIIFIVLKKPIQATQALNWTAIHKKSPIIALDNTKVSIQNIKDFSYSPDGKIQTHRYFDQCFDINQIKAVWYGVAHFSGFGIAHAFLSFEFEDGQFLVTSIEARRKSKEKYSPLKGLFNHYNKIIVFGTESDIIGLRSHYLNHQVYLYPLEMDALESQNLFDGVLQDAIKLQNQPAFYNTFLDNCFTGIAKFNSNWNILRNLFDYRVLLPGFSDALAQKMGLVDQTLPIKALRLKAKVNPNHSQPRDDDFSKQIRKNYHS